MTDMTGRPYQRQCARAREKSLREMSIRRPMGGQPATLHGSGASEGGKTMTDLEKATYYIVGFVDGCLTAVGLREPFGDDTTEEDEIAAVETKRLLPAMRKRIREQYPSLSDEDIDAAYNAASLNSVAYIPEPVRQAEMRDRYFVEQQT
jgi:hypothetical protein